MTRHVQIVALCAVALLALAPAAGAGPVAGASKACDIAGAERDLGVSYVVSLRAKGISCTSAKALIRAYHRCRRVHGLAGRCRRTVRGYRCRESRFDQVSNQFDAQVTCARGGRRISSKYVQTL